MLSLCIHCFFFAPFCFSSVFPLFIFFMFFFGLSLRFSCFSTRSLLILNMPHFVIALSHRIITAAIKKYTINYRLRVYFFSIDILWLFFFFRQPWKVRLSLWRIIIKNFVFPPKIPSISQIKKKCLFVIDELSSNVLHLPQSFASLAMEKLVFRLTAIKNVRLVVFLSSYFFFFLFSSFLFGWLNKVVSLIDIVWRHGIRRLFWVENEVDDGTKMNSRRESRVEIKWIKRQGKCWIKEERRKKTHEFHWQCVD